MAKDSASIVSPITFGIKNLWQLADSYTMNLILFEDDEIESENVEIISSSKEKDEDDATSSGKQLRCIHLKKDEYRCKHIEKVLKSKSGDSVRVGIINGKQGLAKVQWSKDLEVDNQNDDNALIPKQRSFYLRLEIIESSMKDIVDKITESITLILALPRPKVLQRLFPIISSLGVKEIIIVNAQRVEKSYFDSKYLDKDRYTKALLAGMVQCRDTKLPTVSIEKYLKTFICDKLPKMYASKDSIRITAHPGEELKRISELSCFDDAMQDYKSESNENDNNIEMSLDESTNQNTIDIESKARPSKHKQFILAIGPEGGWLDDEISMFEQNDFNICSIGSRILRSDVACISLLSVLRSQIEQYLQLR